MNCFLTLQLKTWMLCALRNSMSASRKANCLSLSQSDKSCHTIHSLVSQRIADYRGWFTRISNRCWQQQWRKVVLVNNNYQIIIKETCNSRLTTKGLFTYYVSRKGGGRVRQLNWSRETCNSRSCWEVRFSRIWWEKSFSKLLRSR